MFRRKHHEVHGHDRIHAPEEEQQKVNELRSLLGTLSERAGKFCSDSCLRRYLHARSWDVLKAKRLLEETLTWRACFKPEEIQWKDVAEEGETGKVYRADFLDKQGRTVLVLAPAKQNTSCSVGQIRHMVYLMENALLNLPPGEEQMVWLIDFTGWSFTTAVSIKTSREATHILQNYYPERLGYALLYNPPRIFQAFWKVVRHFLDPKTYQKVKFVYSDDPNSLNLMEELFDKHKLYTTFGGEKPVAYDHEKHGKQMEEDDFKTKTYWRVE